MVKDPISSNEYQVDEDPTKFVSAKTGRGPLSENWREEYAREISSRGNSRGTGDHAGGRAKKEMMCAYKLCKVEFNYWGMQSKVERFIHDYGRWLEFCLDTEDAFDLLRYSKCLHGK